MSGGFDFNADNGTSGGGGGGGSVAVYNEGVLLTTAASSFDFIGSSIEAIDAGGGKVNVYSPAPTFVSHFNSTDGIGNCTVSDFSVTSRKISAPTSPGTPFDIGSWTAGTSQNSTNSTNISYTTSNACSIFDNTSTNFTVTVYGADGTTVLA